VVDASYQRAEHILKEHIDILHNMAHALMEWETIDKYQIDELMQGKTIAPPEPKVEVVATEAGETETLSIGDEIDLTKPEQGAMILS
jgi:cell division protease FtsH